MQDGSTQQNRDINQDAMEGNDTVPQEEWFEGNIDVTGLDERSHGSDDSEVVFVRNASVGSHVSTESFENVNEAIEPEEEEFNSEDEQPLYGPTRMRGKDKGWRIHKEFVSDTAWSAYKKSEEFVSTYQAGNFYRGCEETSQIFKCRYWKKSGFLGCPFQAKAISYNDKEGVRLMVTHCEHDHGESVADGNNVKKYRWTSAAEKILTDSYAKGKTASKIRSELTDANIAPLPTLKQIENKLAYVKKTKNVCPLFDTANDLKVWCEEHEAVPDANDIHVPYVHGWEVDVSNPMSVRFWYVIVTHKTRGRFDRALHRLLQGDPTYKLNLNGFPGMVLGTSNSVGKFYLGGFAMISNEDHQLFVALFRCLHIDPMYSLFDGAQALTRAVTMLTNDGTWNNHIRRLMCYPHKKRNSDKKIKSVRNKEERNLLAWKLSLLNCLPTSRLEFEMAFELLLSEGGSNEIDAHLDYERQVWIESEESYWFESAAPTICHQAGNEKKNHKVKTDLTERKRLTLGMLTHKALTFVRDESTLEDDDLEADAKDLITLHQLTAGYKWHLETQGQGSRELVKRGNQYFVLPKNAPLGTNLREKAINFLKVTNERNILNFEAASTFDEWRRSHSQVIVIQQVSF